MVEFGYCRFMLFFLRSIFKLDAKWQQNRDSDEGGRRPSDPAFLHLPLSGRNELTWVDGWDPHQDQGRVACIWTDHHACMALAWHTKVWCGRSRRKGTGIRGLIYSCISLHRKTKHSGERAPLTDCDGPFVPGQFGWKVRPSHHSIACSTSSSKSTIHTATLLLVELPPCLLPMH